MAAKGSKAAEGVFVKAPLVAVSTESGAVRHLYHGDVVGDDVTKESVDHLRDLGFVTDSTPVDESDEK